MNYKNILINDFNKYNISKNYLSDIDICGVKKFKSNSDKVILTKKKLNIDANKLFWYQKGGKKKYKIDLNDKYALRMNFYDNQPQLDFVNIKHKPWVAFKVQDLVTGNNHKNSKNFNLMQKKFNKLKNK
jgi:hypothetical protein